MLTHAMTSREEVPAVPHGMLCGADVCATPRGCDIAEMTTNRQVNVDHAADLLPSNWPDYSELRTTLHATLRAMRLICRLRN